MLLVMKSVVMFFIDNDIVILVKFLLLKVDEEDLCIECDVCWG